jgi:hypothetical protein
LFLDFAPLLLAVCFCSWRSYRRRCARSAGPLTVSLTVLLADNPQPSSDSYDQFLEEDVFEDCQSSFFVNIVNFRSNFSSTNHPPFLQPRGAPAAPAPAVTPPFLPTLGMLVSELSLVTDAFEDVQYPCTFVERPRRFPLCNSKEIVVGPSPPGCHELTSPPSLNLSCSLVSFDPPLHFLLLRVLDGVWTRLGDLSTGFASPGQPIQGSPFPDSFFFSGFVTFHPLEHKFQLDLTPRSPDSRSKLLLRSPPHPIMASPFFF